MNKDLQKANFWVLALLSTVYGYGIWVFSTAFTGVKEPWDSESPYYYLSLFIGGFIFGFLGPRYFKRWPIFIYLGQAIFIIYNSLTTPVIGANLFMVGLIFMIFFMLVSLLGSFLGVQSVKLINRFLK